MASLESSELRGGLSHPRAPACPPPFARQERYPSRPVLVTLNRVIALVGSSEVTYTDAPSGLIATPPAPSRESCGRSRQRWRPASAKQSLKLRSPVAASRSNRVKVPL